MINKKQINEIKKLGIKIDHEMAFDGKSKGNKHLFRAVKIAKFLAEKTNAQASIVEASAWLHDTALPTGNDYDYEKNKKVALKLLSSFDIPDTDKNLISMCVASHEGTEKPETLEAKIVHDADVLEKVGLLGIIRHTWKLTNSKKINPDKIKDSDIKEILHHIKWRTNKIETPKARKIAKYLTIPINNKKTKIIISLASNLAMDGIITEKIAIALYKHLNQNEKDKLKEQLSLSYLNKFK